MVFPMTRDEGCARPCFDFILLGEKHLFPLWRAGSTIRQLSAPFFRGVFWCLEARVCEADRAGMPDQPPCYILVAFVACIRANEGREIAKNRKANLQGLLLFTRARGMPLLSSVGRRVNRKTTQRQVGQGTRARGEDEYQRVVWRGRIASYPDPRDLKCPRWSVSCVAQRFYSTKRSRHPKSKKRKLYRAYGCTAVSSISCMVGFWRDPGSQLTAHSSLPVAESSTVPFHYGANKIASVRRKRALRCVCY